MAGNIYAVNFNANGTSAGQIAPTQALFFKSSNDTSLVNGIRFNIDSKGAEEAYIADAVTHQIVQLTGRQDATGIFDKIDIFCQDENMLQPNDLAIASSTGRIFTSGMRWTSDSVVGDGDLWTCGKDGVARSLGTFMRTNGIEVSPDEKTLYLSEAGNKGGSVVSNVIHAFDLDAATGDVSNKRTFVDFAQLDQSEATDIDGMRTDVDGNLYVSRNGLGQVAVFAPAGELTAYINATSIDFVSNLEFGGSNGTDLYLIGRCKEDETKGCADVLKGSAQGRAFSNLQPSAAAPTVTPTDEPNSSSTDKSTTSPTVHRCPSK
ncbi:hypothetical protein GGF37_006090 [Kickxella alabastrina]|nr:hypothetical protein GGF37_006090 [Kickxella alabastrina]